MWLRRYAEFSHRRVVRAFSHRTPRKNIIIIIPDQILHCHVLCASREEVTIHTWRRCVNYSRASARTIGRFPTDTRTLLHRHDDDDPSQRTPLRQCHAAHPFDPVVSSSFSDTPRGHPFTIFFPVVFRLHVSPRLSCDLHERRERRIITGMHTAFTCMRKSVSSSRSRPSSERPHPSCHTRAGPPPVRLVVEREVN